MALAAPFPPSNGDGAEQHFKQLATLGLGTKYGASFDAMRFNPVTGEIVGIVGKSYSHWGTGIIR